jgi:hypothetical protein
MLADIDKLFATTNKSVRVSDYEQTFRVKYPAIASTSKTLFKYIMSNYGTHRFDKAFFLSTIDMMLSNIATIQSSPDTKQAQHDASISVGNHLAHTFIPQLKDS